MPSVKVKFIEGSYTSVSNLVKDLVSNIVTTKIVDTKITSEVLADAVSFGSVMYCSGCIHRN